MNGSREMRRIMDGVDREYDDEDGVSYGVEAEDEDEWIITDDIYGRIDHFIEVTDVNGRGLGYSFPVTVFVVRHEVEGITYNFNKHAYEAELTTQQLIALRDKINETLEMNGCNHHIILSFSEED